MNRFVLILWLLGCASLGRAAEPVRVLEGKLSHLRSGNVPEWQEVSERPPDGKRLDVRFNAQKNASASTLFLRQDGVKLDWRIELNGRKLGSLFAMEAPLVHTIALPSESLRDGENTLSILPPGANDDITVGDIELDSRPLKEAVAQATLEIRVTDLKSGKGLPSRITIVDRQGALTALDAEPGQRLAARPGVVYAGDGRARLGVRPGEYTLFATRGFEYGLDQQTVSIQAGQTKSVALRIGREVPTLGLVSSDTHVHTFTHSHHGDATIDERVLTLAGEGIELPIATDHEYLTDYAEAAAKMGVANDFTGVIGDEVTTAQGHFNAFPIVAGSRVPDNKILDWPKLMAAIRAAPGVRVVILNHPRNIHSNFQPFAATNFNAVTGENRRGFDFGFDAIEVANSSALQSDWRRSFTDWFALLNYGYRLTAVGSSDCHDVSRYIVGQGRCYIACDDAHPDRIDVEAACRSILAGRVLVSMGLLTQIRVNNRFEPGDLATGLRKTIPVTVSVFGPSWIRADRIELFANGVKIREHKISQSEADKARASKRAKPFQAKASWRIPRPRHDVHLIALATGPGVRELFWAIPRPYQPSSPVWEPPVLGCTNPVWIDGDGDGLFTPARAYAQAVVRNYNAELSKVLPALATYDGAVAAQAASLLRQAGRDVQSADCRALLRQLPDTVREGFAEFIEALH